MLKEKLAIIIPTKDRPDELARLIDSIASQGVSPVQTIVVDGGEDPVEEMVKKNHKLHINYLRSRPPSLTVQRNAGIRSVCDDATIVAFLDDDVVLEDDSLVNMMRFWENASADTAGASFNLANVSCKKISFIEKAFFVNADTPYRILRSGFQSKACFVKETMLADWLVGCAMSWRKKVFKEFMFDEWFSGYARYEEVDFSYRVGRKYRMYVVCDAKVRHLNKLEDVDSSASLGRMEVVNRVYFVKKNRGLSLPLCLWALFGILLNNVIKGMLGGNIRYLNRARGNIAGFICLIQEVH